MIWERGGCIANQLLDGLDYPLIRQNPKIISGAAGNVFVEANTDFPILEIGELGHNVENCVFPIGAKATMYTEDMIISIDESPVS